MLNHQLANQLGFRIGARVLLYSFLNALLLSPVVVYMGLDGGFIGLVLQFLMLIAAFSIPMGVLNGIMTRFWMRRIPDNVAITMNPEALRSKLFLSNYLLLPFVYMLMGFAVVLLLPDAIVWWFLAAVGAWLFSGFVSVSAIDRELRWLAIYGDSRKQKSQQAETSRLVTQADTSPIEAETPNSQKMMEC